MKIIVSECDYGLVVSEVNTAQKASVSHIAL